MPFHSDGRPKLDDIPNWLAMRLKEESVMPLETVVVVPGMQDVLLGRGKRVQESAGNFRFKHLLGTHREHYERVSKFEKTIVAESILRLVNESGGRFLKQGDCGWTQVEDEMARKKISHAFRNLRVTPSSIARNSSSAKLKRASLLTFQPSKFQSPK